MFKENWLKAFKLLPLHLIPLKVQWYHDYCSGAKHSVGKQTGFGDSVWHHYVLSVSGGGSDDNGKYSLAWLVIYLSNTPQVSMGYRLINH